MKTVLRNIGSVLAGFILASLVMTLVESFNGHVLYPDLAKAAEGVRDRDVMRRLLASAPIGALLVVNLGWGLGGLAGGWMTGRLAVRPAKSPGLVLCALLTLAGVANNFMLPPPGWYWVTSLAVLAGSTLIGVRVASGARS